MRHKITVTRDRLLGVRLTQTEYDRLLVDARARKQSMSRFARETLIDPYLERRKEKAT